MNRGPAHPTHGSRILAAALGLRPPFTPPELESSQRTERSNGLNTIHRITIVGKCPLGCADVYEVEFHVAGLVIPVEKIQAEIDTVTAEPVYQEHLTQRLANRVGCEVVTFGTHGRFRTECHAEPAKES